MAFPPTENPDISPSPEPSFRPENPRVGGSIPSLGTSSFVIWVL